MMKSNRILIAAGGTGGHIVPALALCAGLKKNGFTCEILTDKRGRVLLGKIAPDQKAHEISAASPFFGNKIQRLLSLFKLVFGVIQSLFHIIKFRPFCVIGFGGYPSAPPLIAARICQLPSLLHEQNAKIGRANLFLANFAKKMLLSWKNSNPLPQKTPVIFSGLPVRNIFFEFADYEDKSEFSIEKPCHLLIAGGSLGAEVFAKLIPTAISNLPQDLQKSLTVTQQVRTEQKSKLEAIYSAMEIRHFCSSFFIKMPDEMAKADVIISRAGAASVAEIAAIGRAAIFIPFPASLDDHQTCNAKCLTDENAAILISQKEAETDPSILTKHLSSLISNPHKCKQMATKARMLAHEGALNEIISAILSCQKPSIRGAK